MQALIASSVFERTGMLVRFQIGRKKKKRKVRLRKLRRRLLHSVYPFDVFFDKT